MTARALSGIRVLDLSRVLAGPFCTQMLGDLGAEIIKIEKPGTGDDTRKWGPPFLKDKNGNDTTESAYYLSANRNKKSVALDVATKEGQEIIHALLAKSDVMIENFKVGGLEKYDLGWEQIKERHPHIIYAAITGFGQAGPLAQEPGYDLMAQGFAGLMGITGEPDGAPMKVGVALSDIMTGLYAAVGILAALNKRHETGKGQMVDVALVDCTLSSLTNIAQYYLTSGTPAARQGNAHSTIVPYQAFEAKDGWIIIAVGNDTQFSRLARTLGHEEWAQDEKFSKNSARVKHRGIIVPLITAKTKTKTVSDWIKILQGIDIPCGPVNQIDQIFAHEQIQARGMKIEMDHPLSAESVSLVGSPLKLSETPVAYDIPPPFCGQHTNEVLTSILDMKESDLRKLKETGVLA